MVMLLICGCVAVAHLLLQLLHGISITQVIQDLFSGYDETTTAKTSILLSMIWTLDFGWKHFPFHHRDPVSQII
jgi:hypothetical protein